jgi:C4-dicarboxylate-specific signal transduction histidine kinase
MASGLAHELNQPLGAILNYAAACLARLESGNASPQSIQQVLENVMVETRRAGQIIADMRAFVRKQQPKSRRVDVNELVEESLRLVQFELARRQVEPSVHLSPNLPDAMADSIQIQQVMVNLICNAIEATDQNAKKERTLAIRTGLKADGEQVELSVTDNGPGISQEILARIYDPFFTTKPNGLGMGLNISRSIIESHGGRLSASPIAEGGMRFSFTLPIASGVTLCRKQPSKAA